MASSNLMLAVLAVLAFVTLTSGSLQRKNAASLTKSEVLSLQTTLRALEEDDSPKGYQQLAAYHGSPSMCEDADGRSVACSVHGMATFPQWHRLYTVHFEQALKQHGLVDIGVPYWDWTEPLNGLPPLVQHYIYRDPQGGLGRRNAWFSGPIKFGHLDTHTARALDDRLFEHVAPGGKSHLFELVLDAMEQDDYCQFEIQFEIAHNHINYLVGGRHEYSMSTVEYSSYDPLFFLHLSNVDRLLAIYLELQKKRGKAYDHADCSVDLFGQSLHPFDLYSNPIELTRTFSKAKDLFSYVQLGYSYDNLSLNGMSVDQLFGLLEQRKGRERAFAVFSLGGLGYSANVKVHVCEGYDDHTHAHFSHGHHCEVAGDFFLLGGANEMPYSFHLPYYFDISDAVEGLGQPQNGEYHVVAEVFNVNGTSLGTNVLPQPYGSHRPIRGHTDPIISHSSGL